MTFSEYCGTNYGELRQIAKNVSNGSELAEDLIQEVMIQLLPKQGLDDMPDEQKKYYIVSVLKLNYFSKTSRFYYNIKKPTKDWFEFKPGWDDEKMIVEEYVDFPDIDWVYCELHKDFHWWKVALFEMWLEHRSLVKVSALTTINKNTVGMHIREIKEELINRWDKQQDK
jgi:hypothetical protein